MLTLGVISSAKWSWVLCGSKSWMFCKGFAESFSLERAVKLDAKARRRNGVFSFVTLPCFLFTLDMALKPQPRSCRSSWRGGHLAPSPLLIHLPLFLAHFLRRKEVWRTTVLTWQKVKPSWIDCSGTDLQISHLLTRPHRKQVRIGRGAQLEHGISWWWTGLPLVLGRHVLCAFSKTIFPKNLLQWYIGLRT